MEIVEIIADEKVYREWHPMIIQRIIDKMQSNPSPVRPKAKNKWLELVYLEREGSHYQVVCHREGEMIVIKKIRKHKVKKRPKFMLKT